MHSFLETPHIAKTSRILLDTLHFKSAWICLENFACCIEILQNFCMRAFSSFHVWKKFRMRACFTWHFDVSDEDGPCVSAQVVFGHEAVLPFVIFSEVLDHQFVRLVHASLQTDALREDSGSPVLEPVDPGFRMSCQFDVYH